MDRPRRLTGVDAARAIALVGMMSVHVLPDRAPDGSVSLAFDVASGRASALFAVLAGVGLALGSGGARPRTGAELNGARRAVVARAVVIAALGLTLGSLGATVAVILAYYGVLFLAAVPVLGWSARRLAVLAAVCTLGAPLLSQVLRTVVRDGPGQNVSWADLDDPARLLGAVLLFGYYPVLTWTAYLFAGMAAGRCVLSRTSTAARLAGAGAALALAGLGIDRLGRALAGGTPELAERLGTSAEALEVTLGTSMFGTTPTASGWWLLLAGRHSGSGPDLLNTGGSALLVIGGCLLVLPRLGRASVLAAPLVAAGAMTLTLYTVHVFTVMVGTGGGPGEPPSSVVLALHVAGAMVLGVAGGAPDRRGPLELLAAVPAEWVRGRPGPDRAPAAGAGGEPPSDATPPG